MAAGMEIAKPVSKEALRFVQRFKTMLKCKTKHLSEEGMVMSYPIDPNELPERWRGGYETDRPAGFVLMGGASCPARAESERCLAQVPGKF